MGEALITLLIGPLQLLMEALFSLGRAWLGHPGWAILLLSGAVSLLTLPLYRRAEAIQRREAEKLARMKPEADHIRQTFRGNERYLMLENCYRIHGYRKADSLKSSLSLLLQIPFFMAAYRFLSGTSALAGVSFWAIADLSQPDGLLTIGGRTIHLLPLLMTAVNLASAALYLKGATRGNRIQTVVLALVFLALLYRAPAGLALYWTANNVFSLGKNLLGRARRRSGDPAVCY